MEHGACQEAQYRLAGHGHSPRYQGQTPENAITLKAQALRIVTWNARGLVHSNAKIARRKFAALKQLLLKHGIVFLREAQGTAADWQVSFSSLR
jgi:hypothetical protein